MKKYNAKAVFSMKRLPLKRVLKEASFGKLRKKEGSFLLYEIEEDQFLYIKDYGAIAFL